VAHDQLILAPDQAAGQFESDGPEGCAEGHAVACLAVGNVNGPAVHEHVRGGGQQPTQEAVELLDMGLEKLPPSQIRFTDSNTYPFLEAYYAASAMGVEDAADKGDALLREYARTLIEYIEYYLRFDGVQGDMVSPIIDEKLDQLGDVYYLAVYAGRKEIIGEINAYYRSLGVEEENLVDVGDKPHQVDTTLIPRKDTAQ